MADLSGSFVTAVAGSSLLSARCFSANDVAPTYSYNHRISGSVKVNGVAASKLVMVFNRETMIMLGIKQSLADGSFEFVGLPENRMPIFPNGLLVLAIDSSEGFNAEIADKIEPVGLGEAM